MDTARTSGTRRTPAALALVVAALTSVATLTPATATADPAPARTVVVTGIEGAAAVARAVRAAGGTVLDSLPLVSGVSALLPADAVLPSSYVVADNRPMSVASEPGDAGTGPVSTVRATVGLAAPAGEGAGVKVALVDTGVDPAVVGLGSRLTHVDVTGAGVGDGYGHGTFIAGLIAGDGGTETRYAGIAPGAELLDVRVADDDGTSSLVTVLKGLQAVAADPDVDVLNLSLSSGSPMPYQIDPLTQALEQLWARGVVVVVPAGNDGPEAGSIGSPGLDPVLLTVGALHEQASADRTDDTVADWSARGPAAQNVAKPDLVAPGARVVSTIVPGSVSAQAQTRTDLPSGFGVGSGTSFSTGIASGAAAVLLSERRLSPNQVKSLVTGTAYAAGGLADPAAAGAGGLDLASARAAAAPPDTAPRGRTSPIPGSPKVWAAFVDALNSGDRQAAANSWSRLSTAAHNWAAHNWAGSSWEAHNWAANSWSAHNWAGADGSAEQWQSRIWAAHNWAAHNWAANSWSAHNWAANSWSAHNWAAHNWASTWAASNWAANSWSAHNWAAHNWAASNWAASNWAASNWAASNWAASNWAASNWAAADWG